MEPVDIRSLIEEAGKNMDERGRKVCGCCRRPTHHLHFLFEGFASVCTACRDGMRKFDMDPARIRAAADYIERTRG